MTSCGLVLTATLLSALSETGGVDSTALRLSGCPACVVLGRARINLPESEIDAWSVKLLNPVSGARTALALARNKSGELELKDGRALLEVEEQARRGKFGALQRELAEKMASVDSETLLPVWILAKWQLPDFDSERDPVRAKRAVQQNEVSRSAVLDAIALVGGQDLQADSTPIVKTRLNSAAIMQIGSQKAVAAIGLAKPGKPMSSVWYDLLSLPQAYGIASGQVKIGVHEGCQPDDYSVLPSSVVSPNPFACTHNHMKFVSAVIANTLSVQGSDRNATLYMLPWNNWSASGLPYVGPVEWANANGVNIYNFSYAMSDGRPEGLGGVDMQMDYRALHPPYNMWVLAAGNCKPPGLGEYCLQAWDCCKGNCVNGACSEVPGPIPYVTVVNRGYNGLIVGASSDRWTPTPSDDVLSPYTHWANPLTAHGDYSLPNLVAPGRDVDVLGFAVTGTSYSAPMVAGCLGLAVSRNPLLHSWPEALRALAMATTIGQVDGQFTNTGSGYELRAGTGQLNCFQLAYSATEQFRALPGASGGAIGHDRGSFNFSSSFDSVGESFNAWYATSNISTQARLRVVLAFDGTAGGCNPDGTGCGSPVVTGDLDLILYKWLPYGGSGSWVFAAAGSSFDGSWEGVDVIAQPGDLWKITVGRNAVSASGTWFGLAWKHY